jgi:hypothetical protein
MRALEFLLDGVKADRLFGDGGFAFANDAGIIGGPAEDGDSHKALQIARSGHGQWESVGCGCW